MSKKKRKNSRQKGVRGETQVRKAFEAWWGGSFYRTPGSGSFATRGFSHEDMSLAGDVVTDDETFPFCLEVKNAEGWHLEQLLTAPECDIIKWWRQAVEETPEGKMPLLVFTRNHQPLFFMLAEMTWVSYRMFTPCKNGAVNPTVVYAKIDGTGVAIGRLKEDFCDKCTPESWREFHKWQQEKEKESGAS